MPNQQDVDEKLFNSTKALDRWSREEDDIYQFHTKFDLPIGINPAFANHQDMLYRLCFLSEELNETMRAYANDDLEEFFDGLIDLVYVAIGTAVWCGLPWKQGWDAVHAANMTKIKTARAEDSKRKHVHDVVKPEGWQKANLKQILKEAGWQEELTVEK